MLESWNYTLFFIPIITALFSLGWTVFLIVTIVKFNKRDEPKAQLMEEYASHNKLLATKFDELNNRISELENRG